MTALPRELEDFLPEEMASDDLAAVALLSRSFDRYTGEALVVRHRNGQLSVLTRPSRGELFRELPRDPAVDMLVEQIGSAEPRFSVRTIDGRTLTMSILLSEVPELRGVLETDVVVPLVRSSAPPRAGTPRPRPRRREDTLRPPESAEMEVVLLPTGYRVSDRPPSEVTARSPSPRPALAPHAGAEPRREGDSVRPPAFAAEPAPVVRGARDVDAMHTMMRRHFEKGALDEAACVARVLAHLGAADAMEKRLATLLPDMPPPFSTPLSPYLFSAYVVHDEEDPDVGRMMSALWPAILAMRTRPERDFGLRPRDEVDIGPSSPEIASLFAHGARAIGLSCPRLFVRTDVGGGLAHLAVSPLASLAGGTIAKQFDPPSTLHVLGGHLAMYRPEAYLFALLPSREEAWLAFRAALVYEDRVPPEPRSAALAAELGRYMVPPVQKALKQAVLELRLPGDPALSAEEQFHRFRRATYLTACRTGFLLSGSLAISEKLQRLLPAVPGVPTDEVIDDLVSYAVSPSWMALRRELGISLEPSGQVRLDP
jgi:hypothetical protein